MSFQTSKPLVGSGSNFPSPNNYTLTIGEASALMKLENCKFASPRKVQRLCRDGQIDCQKITTSRNGQPIIEWLVDENSLRKRIAVFEPLLDSSDALAMPLEAGDASFTKVSNDQLTTPVYDMATPNQGGDAHFVDSYKSYSKGTREDLAPSDEDGDTSCNEPSKAMLMIENARLTAELAGKSEFIDQILDEKSFLREELKDARERGRDVTKIAERMLETLETIAMGGKLQQLAEQQAGEIQASPEPKKFGDSHKDENERFRI